MITLEILTSAGIAEDKAQSILTDLGDYAKKLTPENVAKKAYDDVDLAVLTHTKIPKNENEKTTDYVKRAMNEKADNLVTEKTKELNTKIKDVEEKLKNHKGDETLKAELQALKDEKAKLPDLKAEWIKEYKEKAEAAESKLTEFERISILKSAIPGNLKKDLTKDYIDFKIEKAIEKALKKYDKTETGSDGTLFLIDSVKVDKDDAKEFFKTELKDILDEGTIQQGGGADSSTNPQKDLNLDDTMNDSTKISKIREYLATQKGIDSLDPRYQDEFNKLLKEHKLDKYITVKEKK